MDTIFFAFGILFFTLTAVCEVLGIIYIKIADRDPLMIGLGAVLMAAGCVTFAFCYDAMSNAFI